MTQEEKARAYDEALEKAKIEINTKGIGETVNLCYQLFPELAESEYENLKNKSGYYKDGKFWKASTLWNATKNKIPQRVSNRYILQECTWNIGTLQRFANEVKNVQEVSLDYPIILDMNGNILDGAHRVVKAYLEGKDIDIVYLGDDEWPEPDYDEEKAVKESEDERIRKFLIQHISEWIGCIEHDLKNSSKDIESENELAMFKAGLAYLEKQKESLPISEIGKENANSFIDGIIEVRSFQRGMEEGRKLEKQKEQKPIECIEFDNEFEKQVSHLLASVLNGEWEYNEGFVKHAAQSLLGYAKNELKQKLPLMGVDTDTYFDDLRITTKPLTSREWFDEGIKYAQRLQKEQKQVQTTEEKEYVRTLKGLVSDFIRACAGDIFDTGYYQRICDWLDGRHVPFSCGHENGKPTEWDNLQEEFRNINEAFEDGKKEVIDHPDKYGLTKQKTPDPVFSKQEYESYPIISTDTTSAKPVERSLEDDHIIGFVYDLLNEIEWKDDWAMSKEECLRLLSNYSPQKFTGATINGEPISTENQSVDIPLAEWSEEDEEMRDTCIDLLKHFPRPCGEVIGPWKDCTAWLKSLPEKFVLQPKQEWSEEDGKTINDACCWIAEYAGYLMDKNYGKASMLMGLTDKLKSLRPQSQGIYQQVVKGIRDMCDRYEQNGMFTDERARDFLGNVRVKCKDAIECAPILDEPSWKPSEEQMEELNKACRFIPYNCDVMAQLYEQLKKL